MSCVSIIQWDNSWLTHRMSVINSFYVRKLDYYWFIWLFVAVLSSDKQYWINVHWTFGAYFNEISIKIHPFSFRKMNLKILSAKRTRTTGDRWIPFTRTKNSRRIEGSSVLIHTGMHRTKNFKGFWYFRSLLIFFPQNAIEFAVCKMAAFHCNDVIMGAMASQMTSLTIVYSTVYSGADERKHHSSASLASVRGIHRWLVNSPHKWPETRKMFPFDDVIMFLVLNGANIWCHSEVATENKIQQECRYENR